MAAHIAWTRRAMLPGNLCRAGRCRKTASNRSGSSSAISRGSRRPRRCCSSYGPPNAFSILTCWSRTIPIRSASGSRGGERAPRRRPPPPPADPADAAVRSDLLTALRALPPRLSAAIVLRHYHGYNNREIAAALGVSERTVGTRLRQAGERLRAVLKPSFSLDSAPAFPSDQRELYAED